MIVVVETYTIITQLPPRKTWRCVLYNYYFLSCAPVYPIDSYFPYQAGGAIQQKRPSVSSGYDSPSHIQQPWKLVIPYQPHRASKKSIFSFWWYYLQPVPGKVIVVESPNDLSNVKKGDDNV